MNAKLTADQKSKEADLTQREYAENEDEDMSVEDEGVIEHASEDINSGSRLPEAPAVALPDSDNEDGIL